jgi:hypothetical protein
MKMYYLHNGKEKEGPFDLETLKTRNITNDTPVWYDGLSDWTIAEKVYELRDLFPLMSDPVPGTLQEPPPLFRPEVERKEKRSPRKVILTIILILIVVFTGFVLLDLLDRPSLFE